MKDTAALKMSLALLMKAGRQRKNLSCRELAALVGVSPRTIWNYENEVSLPIMGTCAKILDTLGYTFQTLNTICDYIQ